MTKFSSLALALAASTCVTLAVPVPAQAAQPAAIHGDAQSLNTTDRDFMKQAAQSLKFEAAAAQLAQQQGHRDQIKSYGKKDEAFVQRLSRALEKLADKKSVQLPNDPDGEQAERLARLKGLQGEAFDQAFVELAGSAHHFEVVDAFRRTAERSVDVDVRGFARTWLHQVHQRFTMVNSVTSDIAPEALKPSPETAPRRNEGPRTDTQPDAQGKATN